MINNKKILSVITARKGSKGIKNKNIKELMGKPLFMWSVLASLDSKYVDKTVISSDSELIEEIYIENIRRDKKWKKVSFVKRPKEISGDLSINEEALIHAYNWMKEIEDTDYSIVYNLQPTSPVRLNRILDKSIEEYVDGEYDSLLTVLEMTPFFWQKIKGKWEYIDRNFSWGYVEKSYQPSKQYQFIKSFDGCCERKMRQQIYESKMLFHDCGNLYGVDTKVLLSTNCRIGKNPIVFPVDKLNSLQIDTEFDFKLIENMIKSYNLENLY